MEDFLLKILLLPFVCGIVFIPAGIILYFFPPKKINYLYGYRTKSSMKSHERWTFAQKFAAIQMIKGGFFLASMSLLGLFFESSENANLIIGIILAFIPVIYVFKTTEKELKRRFNT